MKSKLLIFLFHFKNITRTLQSVVLLVLFIIGTAAAVLFLHDIKTHTENSKNAVCVEIKNDKLKEYKKIENNCSSEDSKKISLDLKDSKLIVSSDEREVAQQVKEMISTNVINKLGNAKMLPYNNIETNITNSKKQDGFTIYSVLIFYITMFSGLILVASIALEKINKLRLMTQFKLSSNFLIFTKIFSVFLQIAILIGLSTATLFYFNSTKYIDLNDIKELFIIKTNLWLTIYLHVTNLVISYYFVAFIGSSIKTQEEIQNKGFISNLLFMFAFMLSSVFSLIDENIQNVIKYIPIMSSFVLDKVNDLNVWIVVPIQLVIMILIIAITTKKFKEI